MEAVNPKFAGIEAILDQEWIDSLMVNFMSAVQVTNPSIRTLRESSSGVLP